MKKLLAAAAAAFVLACMAVPVRAATTAASGYLYSREVLTQLTEGCVAHAPGGVYVGIGPALSFPAAGGTRSIVFVSDSGASRVVATGLNSVSDCLWDAASNLLYVTDSGLEFAGATTGDTVFAIPGDAAGLDVDGHEVLAAGSIPYAFGIDRTPNGLAVTDAAGAGAGSVVAIDLGAVPVATSTFASGFDYTGGILVEAAHVFVAEAREPAFDSVIHSFSPLGVAEADFSGPGYDHGSVDLARARDGRMLVTGAPTLVAVNDAGVAEPLVAGLDGGTGFDAFGGGVSVDAFTGRIDFLASSFSGADDDSSLHRLVPVDGLVPGGGQPSSDCAMELYGLSIPDIAPGQPGRDAVCVDGAACDGDGKVDGGCTFPLGLCFNAVDPRLPECTPGGVASLRLLGAKPTSASLDALVAKAESLLPIAGGTCVFGDGVRVPIKTLSSGRTKAGRGIVKMTATTSDAAPRKDTDVVRLVCTPAS